MKYAIPFTALVGLLSACATLNVAPSPYRPGTYNTELPIEYGYLDNCDALLKHRNSCETRFLGNNATTERSLWWMAVYRAAEVGVAANYSYMTIRSPFPKMDTVVIKGKRQGSVGSVEVTYFREIPDIRANPFAVYKTHVLLQRNGANPNAPPPQEALVTGADRAAAGKL
ncbi:hypothetical protein [Thauera propionica]|uniref:hypothetical protein n=1 Tax=Thauera propionica TaxID=2019431 RepID=UPI0023EFB4BD|nr:hypothetical protein [Thauera propionica]MDD3675989.1 hypothetical protein [Thauera propionica]